MNSIILEKSKAFALHIIKLYQYLCTEKKEFVISKQILRSGTSVGANVSEAIKGQSKADFLSKMYIAFKEANETQYWLELLFESDYMDKDIFDVFYAESEEIIKILSSITKTTKNAG